VVEVRWDLRFFAPPGVGVFTAFAVLDLQRVAVTVVQSWIDTPATNYGLILKKDPETGNTPRCYPYMRESSNGVQLIVTYTPNSTVTPDSLGKVKALYR